MAATKAPRYRAVVFDLDGVLFDSEPLHRRAWIESMQRLGHAVDEVQLLPWTGIPCRTLSEHFAQTLTPKRPWREYHDGKQARFQELVSRGLRVFEGVEALIVQLARCVPIAYATSNSRDDARIMLDAAHLSGRFSAGVTFDDVAEHKPHPEPYLRAAEMLAIPPRECIAVEDSPAGVRSAAAAGMHVVAVSTSVGKEQLARAHAVVASTADGCRTVLGLVAASEAGTGHD
jgi:HAD superfamily hydrolase (TIGR01509 family)